MDPDRALEKLRALCAKQERCRSELRQKLVAWALDENEHDGLLDRLTQEGFLDEHRFAQHFAVSKLRQSGWGRSKIRAALEEKEVGEVDIAAGLAGIDEAEYRAVLAKLVVRQGRDAATHAYLTGRGFEEHLVEEALRR